MKELGIDVSKWRPKLKKSALEGHVKWISAKAGEVDDRLYNGWNARMSVDQFVDPTFADHCQTAYDIGARFVPFIFANTIYKSEYYASAYADHVKHPNDLDPEILMLRQALKNKMYHGFVIDAERWWRRYNPYLAMLRGEISGSLVEKVPSLWIRNSLEDLYIRVREEMGKGNFRDVPIWFYLGRWFVIGYCPELDTFLQDKIQWLTEYRTAVHKAAIQTSKTKIGSWVGLEALIAETTFKTDWVGEKPCEAMQLTDKYYLPGITDDDAAETPLSVDVDITVADWSLLFKDAGAPVPTPTPIEVPPPAPVATKKVARVLTSTLRMRSTPTTGLTTNVVRKLKQDDQVDVSEVITDSDGNTWAVTTIKAYVAIKNRGVTFSQVEEVPV